MKAIFFRTFLGLFLALCFVTSASAAKSYSYFRLGSAVDDNTVFDFSSHSPLASRALQ